MELFAEGGLKDEGGEVDEVSGNEVPIGGTKKGVRDDIPAMVSEGEFVFPEDVTRYIGLENLMRMRQEAKQGLKMMEAMGQMGNGDEATIPDDLPFEMSDLIVVQIAEGEEEEEPKKKANGGVLEANQGLLVTQTDPTQNLMTTPFQPLSTTSVTGGNENLNPYYTPPPSTQFTPQYQPDTTGGFTPQFGGTPVTVSPVVSPTVRTEEEEPFVPEVGDMYTTVKYVDPSTGATLDINFYQGNPVQAIPAGYIPYDEYDAEADTETGVQTARVQTATTRDDDDKLGKGIIDFKKNQQRKKAQDFNNLLNKTSFTQADKDDLLKEWQSNKKGLGFATAMTAFSGPIGMAARYAANKSGERIEDALTRAYGGDSWKDEPVVKEYDATGFIGKGIQGVKGIASDVVEDVTNIFTGDWKSEYKPAYDVNAFAKSVTGNDKLTFTGYNGKGNYGNLTVQQQNNFDNAMRNDNKQIVDHFTRIAENNHAKDTFAVINASLINDYKNATTEEDKAEAYRKLTANTTVNGITLGDSAIQEIIKYGSSNATAVNLGKATEGNLFNPSEVTDKGNAVITSDDMNTGVQTTTPVQTTQDDDDSPSFTESVSQVVSDIGSGIKQAYNDIISIFKR